MSTNSKDTDKQPPADWSSAMTLRLVTVLLDEASLRKRAGTGFKLSSYERATREVNTEFDPSGKLADLTIKQVKNKITNLKKDFDLFLYVKGCPGVVWSDETKMLSAEASVWESILMAYPKARKFKKKGLEFLPQLQDLFAPSRDTGVHVQLPSQLATTTSSKRTEGRDTSQAEKYLFAETTNVRSAPPQGTEQDTDGEKEQEENSLFVSCDKPGPADTALKKAAFRKRPAADEPDGSVPSLAGSSKKSSNRKRMSTGQEIANSITGLQTTAVDLHRQTSKVARAIEKVQEEYMELDVEELVYAYNVFSDVRKAEMFVVMKEGAARDLWLEKEIHRMQQLSEGEGE
ncbi:hypothetical protein FN846DRAFT_35439 [Sphaerosporella brunnea]|uniref:Myb/SANT-like domain-containing protein n=1 Tax=Sphaerosporella brunnea TaxID=1250544 RepID=A0A5J5EV00_9PEZI|nr:hypothetical protein FN846DRAFT_35439 [Sphaerosporella brunnea]